jgi:hypothetical protein
MPPSMRGSVHRRLLACLLVLVVCLGVAACGNKDEKPGVDEPAREGLALPLDGIDYNVFITRQLNPRVPPDGAYVSEDAPAGQTLLGIFIEACNNSGEQHQTISKFVVKDNQENEFRPKDLPQDNPFVYSPRALDPHECIPQAGSVAQLGPTAGALLLFQLPTQATENRPLELELEGDSGDKLTFMLDI